MTLQRKLLVIPSARRNSSSNMLYFIKKVKAVVGMVSSKPRESRQGVITSAGMWPELTQSLWEGWGDVQGPSTLLRVHTCLHKFTLQLSFCKNNLTPEGYRRHNGARSLSNCALLLSHRGVFLRYNNQTVLQKYRLSSSGPSCIYHHVPIIFHDLFTSFQSPHTEHFCRT